MPFFDWLRCSLSSLQKFRCPRNSDLAIIDFRQQEKVLIFYLTEEFGKSAQ